MAVGVRAKCHTSNVPSAWPTQQEKAVPPTRCVPAARRAYVLNTTRDYPSPRHHTHFQTEVSQHVVPSPLFFRGRMPQGALSRPWRRHESPFAREGNSACAGNGACLAAWAATAPSLNRCQQPSFKRGLTTGLSGGADDPRTWQNRVMFCDTCANMARGRNLAHTTKCTSAGDAIADITNHSGYYA